MSLAEVAIVAPAVSALSYAAGVVVETGIGYIRLRMNDPDEALKDMRNRLDEVKSGLGELESKQRESAIYLSVSKTNKEVDLTNLKLELDSCEYDYREFKSEYLGYSTWKMLSKRGSELYTEIMNLSTRVRTLNANFLKTSQRVLATPDAKKRFQERRDRILEERWRIAFETGIPEF
ncbi:uncharacterized protein PHACADRAFT_265702 [Phanerochaete carnosa HHB-10118-sp]|uniref:Uncharacterized protein n=1 Tax=Phanerochaete carnosa (strain HHB-10118-sp) TaxID=650164 RepID=K5VRY6_PHACS|nr:uncharacterized protein PHACADRAFT_265702 [Phanerochaete carnosa HHB-10118-sp]EKM49304.1 hypothetical protein PHACADRAFT_265702 [Phanerochaete carnosa HHB-10118-sp]